MNKLLNLANDYIKSCDWKEISALKLCLCAIGTLIGIAIPARKKKPAAWIASAVFIATYIPLMVKFLPCLNRSRMEDLYE